MATFAEIRPVQAFFYKILFSLLNRISRLPFSVLHRVSDVLFWLVCYGVGYRKRMVLGNLRRAFPGKSDAEIKQISTAFYRHFTDLIVESVKSATMDQEEFQRRYRVTNQPLLDEYHRTGKSVIVLSPHTGNWEWIFSLVHVIPYDVYAVYQPLTNPYFDAYVRSTRQRYEAMMIPMKETSAKVREAEASGRQVLTWFAADQACKPHKAQWVRFLGQDTTFHRGYERLARETNLAVFFLDIRKVGRSYYELTLVPITQTPRDLPEGAIVDAFARLTEQRIRTDPAYWLWSHNRWKHRREPYA